MNDFVGVAVFLILLSLAFVAGFLFYIWYQQKPNTRAWLKSDLGKGSMVGWLGVPMITAVVGVAMLFGSYRADAGGVDVGWFSYAGYDAGVLKSYRETSICGEGGVSDRIVSDIEIYHNVFNVKYKQTTFDFNVVFASHNSCVFNEDEFVFDGGGVDLSFRHYW